MTKRETYILEICTPGSIRDVLQCFESPVPFLTITVGDLINPAAWNKKWAPDKLLRVVSVEHIVWQHEGGEFHHKLCVFTKEVPDRESTRLQS